MSGQSQTSILVVGGRTTGLMMACQLARHGMPVRIIDKSPGIDPHSRATVLHSRTLEILDDLGIARTLMKLAQPLRGLQIFANGQFVGRSDEKGVDSPFPFSAAVSQAKTESILERCLNELGVFVQRSTELVTIDQNMETVRATLLHSDGQQEEIETPWLIGCDGAHSIVRQKIDETFPGQADPHPYMLADVVVQGDIVPEDAYFFFHDDGDLFFFILDEGRRLVTGTVPAGTDISRPPTLEQMQSVVDRRTRPGYRLVDPRWLTYYHIHYRLAPHYRSGRIFLAGDAAHVHSLIGGHGMNTGMQDAHNLAWKIALVSREVVPDRWLDSYEVERRAVAAGVLETTRRVTSDAELFSSLSDPERAKLLEQMFVPESEKLRVRLSNEELDLDYSSSPICFDPKDSFTAGPAVGTRASEVSSLIVDGQSRSLLEILNTDSHCMLLFPSTPSLKAEDTMPVTALSTDEISRATDEISRATDEISRATDEISRAIDDIDKAIGGKYRSWVRLFVVAIHSPGRGLPKGIELIIDASGSLHRQYGADEPCLYLIRPDGYVAYRSRDIENFDNDFGPVLAPRPPDED